MYKWDCKEAYLSVNVATWNFREIVENYSRVVFKNKQGWFVLMTETRCNSTTSNINLLLTLCVTTEHNLERFPLEIFTWSWPGKCGGTGWIETVPFPASLGNYVKIIRKPTRTCLSHKPTQGPTHSQVILMHLTIITHECAHLRWITYQTYANEISIIQLNDISQWLRHKLAWFRNNVDDIVWRTNFGFTWVIQAFNSPAIDFHHLATSKLQGSKGPTWN